LLLFSSFGSQLLAVGKVFEDKTTPETKAYGRVTVNVCQLYQKCSAHADKLVILPSPFPIVHVSLPLSLGACKTFKINVL